MKEAIGNSFILYAIITFLVVFMLVFAGTTAYTKAFKVKNKLIDTIEYYDGEIESNNKLNNNVQKDMTQKLGSIGYRQDREKSECTTDGRYNDGKAIMKANDSYRYCIYRYDSKRGKHYAVVVYAYLEIPLIGAKLDLPVYGETKTFLNF